jgi:DNA-binding FadR family transcriptional regulator
MELGGTLGQNGEANARAYKLGAGEIAVQVRRQITGGVLLDGERLPPERAFAEQFGVSRGTVRDALKRLEEAGFVEKRAGSGSYVSHSQQEDTPGIAKVTSPLELVDTRFALEPQIVRLAVLNATEYQLGKAEQALQSMESCGQATEVFAAADDAFHLAFAECTRNSMLVWISKRVSEVRNNNEWSRMRAKTLTAAMIVRYNQQHREILDAVRARDAEHASRAMREHLGLARDSLLAAASS